MSYRFHILGIPHTASNVRHVSCAYTQKVVKLCAMMKRAGHHVIHYGCDASEVECDEQVAVTSAKDLDRQYGDRWMTDQYSFDLADPVYRKFFANAAKAVGKRKQPRDFLLCMWGAGHRPVADAHADLIVVEPGIGYAGGHFAKFKVFESYAIFHAYYGLHAVGNAVMNGAWYDTVIPNYFEPADFTYRENKEDYLLFLGRVGDGKGTYIAGQIAERAGMRLVIAGPGNPAHMSEELRKSFVGFADHATRRELLAKARALIAPTMYIEPFGGVQIEALMSGTPTITTDWGAFAENNLHGITGWRCRTMEQFVWAAKNAEKISPRACRQWALRNFSTQRVAPMYQEFFQMVMDVHSGDGWYAPHPERTELDWMTRSYPDAARQPGQPAHRSQPRPVRFLAPAGS